MKNEFVPYEQSLELKELGFDEPCFTYYFCNGILSDTPRESGDDIKYQGDCKFDNHQNSYLEEDDDCSAPLFSQAFRWFRENYGLSGWVNESFVGSSQGVISIKSEIGLKYHTAVTKLFDTYEEAELECLKKLIEIVKSKTL